MTLKTLRPQPGPQEQFLSTPADGAILGGAAGGGKSFGLLLEPVRHYNVPGFGGTIFRRTFPEIANQGGLWDESQEIYRLLKGTTNKSDLKWTFPAGAAIKFSHLNTEEDKHSYQGAQICYLGFDEITHFSASQFWYLLSRNRSTCGIRPYWRGTCNPDPDSWVADFISWWINQDTGYAIKERSGVIRWYIRSGNDLIWADTKEELLSEYGPDILPASFTFIAASVYDNKILLEKDPGYLAKLKSLPYVERMRLLGGNWKIRATAGKVFKREWFDIVPCAPKQIAKSVRFWDIAATEPTKKNKDPDYTAGVKMVMDENKVIYVVDVQRFRKSPGDTQNLILQTAQLDGVGVKILMEQEGGASGKTVIETYRKALLGYTFSGEPAKQNKLQRANPMSGYAEGRNIKLVAGDWNKAYLDELENFPDAAHDDQVDASSGAFEELANVAPAAWGQPEPDKNTRGGYGLRGSYGGGLRGSY